VGYRPLIGSIIFVACAREKRHELFDHITIKVSDIPCQQEFQSDLDRLIYMIGASKGQVVMKPQLTKGVMVRVRRGTFEGMTGTVERRNGAFFLVINLPLFQRSCETKILAEDVELYGSAGAN
jgi:transcription antitermination factor NusG